MPNLEKEFFAHSTHVLALALFETERNNNDAAVCDRSAVDT